jgi:hypothetical protein
MAGFDRGTGEGRPWGFILTIGAVLAAAVAILVVPGLLSPKAPPPASHAPAQESHILTTSQGTYSIGYVDGAIVVVERNPVPDELGRAVVPDSMLPTASGEPLNGSGVWVLACPGAPGGDPFRVLFGTLYPNTDATYTGPPAAYTFAADGLWLVVLQPGHLDPGAGIRIESSGGASGVDAISFDLALRDGTAQPSGCFVDG